MGSKLIRVVAPLTLAVSAFILLSPSLAPAYEVQADLAGGTVSGTVRFKGAAPAPAALPITKDPAVCGKTKKVSEELVVSANKGLANVVVFIEKIGKGKAVTPGSAEISNTDCRYEPHVQAFVAGTELKVKNADAVLHNTHAKLKKLDVFNFALPNQGQVLTAKVKDPGLIKVGCDAGHTWMTAYIAVFDHPYFAVTDAEGKFTLADVPPGDYTLSYWHEKLGKKTAKIKVTAGAGTDASLEMQ